MQLKFKLRHKGSTQKLNLSSLPTWSTITERIGRAFSLVPEDVALAYKGRGDTEALVTSREELDEYIKVNDVQKTGQTMEFEVRDSRAWSSLAGSGVEGARISEEYDDMPDVSPRSPHGFTYVTQLPHRHDPFIFSEADLFGPSSFSGHTPIIQVMPLRGMDPDTFSTGFIETVPTSEENINPEVTPVQRGDDIQTVLVTSLDEPPKISTKDKGKRKAQEVSGREKASDFSKKGGHVDRKPTTHVPNHPDPPTPVPLPSSTQDEHVRNHSRSAESDTPRAAHGALTDGGAPPKTTLDVGSVEAVNHLSQLFGAITEFLRAYPTISQNMSDILAGFHGLDLYKEVEATRDTDGKARQRMHQAEVDIAQRNLMRSALEMMRQFSKAMEPGAIDSPGDYSFPQINVPVPVPQAATRAATYSSAADRVSLPPAPPEILAGLDSRARLEAAKTLYKQEKERYKEDRERKRKERMGRIASNARNIHFLDPPRPPVASHSRGAVPTRIHIPERVGVPKAMNPLDYAMEDHASSAPALPNAKGKEKERTKEREKKRRSEEKDKDRRPSYGRDNYDRKQNTLTDYDPRPIFTPTDIKPMPGVPGMGVAYVPVPLPIPLVPSAGAPPLPPPPPPPVAPTAASTKKKEGETERAKGKEKEKEKPKGDSDDEENWYPFMPKFLDHGAPAAIYHQRQRSMHLSELEEERRRSMVEPEPGVRANTDSAVDVNASLDPLGPRTDDEDIISTDDDEPEPPRPWVAPTFTTASITPQFKSSILGNAVEESVWRNPVPKMYQKVERFGEGMGASRFVAGAEKDVTGDRYTSGYSGLPAQYGFGDEGDSTEERRYIGTTTTATQTDTETIRGAPSFPMPKRNGQRF